MKMNKMDFIPLQALIVTLAVVFLSSCGVSEIKIREKSDILPLAYRDSLDNLESDSLSVADISWKGYFSDPQLQSLIDSALSNNQELQILLQELNIRRNEVSARSGEYLPFVDIGGGVGVEKDGRYTRHGAVDEQLDIKEGEPIPDPLTDFRIGANISWEVDIWDKLHNAERAALERYLAGVEGRNFMVTNLVAEISETYYELLALDNQLLIIEESITLQSDMLSVVKQQKIAAKATQLAVNRFEAQLFNTKNKQYEIEQRIRVLENKMSYLTGSFMADLPRDPESFMSIQTDTLSAGVPSNLLANRPDIRRAEHLIKASQLDVEVARAKFYPRLELSAGIGFSSFNPVYLVNPESIFYNTVGDIMAPIINRKAIQAEYQSASAEQLQHVIEYEQTLLNAYTDVLNQLSKIQNYSQSRSVKEKEVEILNQSVNISKSLYNSARADYGEVLLTQREALEAKLELIEVQAELLSGKVNLYRALGGGWK